jgi:hypothetical protein
MDPNQFIELMQQMRADSAAMRETNAALRAENTALIQGLLNRLGPVQAEAVPQPIRAIMPRDITYSGFPKEDYDEWVLAVNTRANQEVWGDNDKLRAAIGSLQGIARQWHLDFGIAHQDWAAWEQALRQAFVAPMDDFAWRITMENRVQRHNESTREYVFSKVALFRKKPGPQLAEADKIPYLVRGLRCAELKVAMLANTPQTIAAFMTAVDQKEVMLTNPITPELMAHLQLAPQTSSQSKLPVSGPKEAQSQQQTGDQVDSETVRSLTRTIGQLTRRIDQMERSSVNTRSVMGYPPSLSGRPPVVTGASTMPVEQRGISPARDPPTIGFRDCHNCGMHRHWRRDCPKLERASGNDQAGLREQGRQNQRR